MEAVAETSEEFMERYFNGESFSEAEIRAALRTNVMDGSIVPMSHGPADGKEPSSYRTYRSCLTRPV